VNLKTLIFVFIIITAFLLSSEYQIAIYAQDSYKIIQNFNHIPLTFTRNTGLFNPEVKFCAHTNGFNLFFTGKEITYLFRQKDKTSQIEAERSAESKYVKIRQRFLHANPSPEVTGEKKVPWNTNYLTGNDRKQWKTTIPNYEKVRIKNIYDGIDLICYGNKNRLKYDYVIQPGSNPEQILITYASNSKEKIKLSVNRQGELEINTSNGKVIERKPYAYQLIDGDKAEIDAGYEIVNPDKNIYRFAVAQYNKAYPLIIDPEIIFSTYIGGSGIDRSSVITVDKSCNVYIAGDTESPDFPVTPDTIGETYNGNKDIFVCKVNKNGTELEYCTIIGGKNKEVGNCIAVDSSGCVFLSGSTHSPDFPVTSGAFDTDFKNSEEVYICKINPDGTGLEFSTFLSGSGTERAQDLKIDDNGTVYVAGYTKSNDFPVTEGTLHTDMVEGSNVFIAQINRTGTVLLKSAVFGGRGNDEIRDIIVDTQNNIYVAGFTMSNDFPLTHGAYDDTFNGKIDIFVCKFDSSLKKMEYSTYFGGDKNDEGGFITTDRSGNVYITGKTNSRNFPSTTGEKYNGGDFDIFTAKLNEKGSGLLFSTYIGGIGDDQAMDIEMDQTGNVFIVGITNSINYPVTSTTYDNSFNSGDYDIILTVIDSSHAGILYSSFLGGSGSDIPRSVVLDERNNVYITGQTSSPDFPVSSDCFDDTFNGEEDAFVLKLTPFDTAEESGVWFKGVLAARTEDPEGLTHIVTIDSTCSFDYLAYFQLFELYGNPVFSPDGKSVHFSIETDTVIEAQSFKLWDLCTMTITKPERREIKQLHEFNPVWYLSPSPGGNNLIYAPGKNANDRVVEVRRENMKKEIYKIDLNVPEERGINIQHPEYSPDGNYIIFTNSPVNARFSDIYIKDLIRDETRRFLMQQEAVSKIEWSPAGRRIVIGREDKTNLVMFWPDKSREIDLKSVLRSYCQKMDFKNLYVESFDWSPDGEEIMLCVRIENSEELWVTDKNFREIRKIMEISGYKVLDISWGGYPRVPFKGKIEIAGTVIAGKNSGWYVVFGFIILLSAVTSVSLYARNRRKKMFLEERAIRHKKEQERSRKELMLLLRDFDHSGMAAKIFDNMEFCFRNIFSGEIPEHDLKQNMNELVTKYEQIVTPAVGKIVKTGRELRDIELFIDKIKNLNGRILGMLETLNYPGTVDEIFIHDLNYLTESFNLNVKMTIEHLHSFFKTDIWKCTQTIIKLMQGNCKDIAINLFDDGLIDPYAVIEEDDYTFVLENLLSNAVTAVHGSETKGIDVVLHSDRRRIFVEVRDTGCGIPGKKWEHIFLENDDEKGYGLSRSLSLLSIYGGKLKVKESTVGEGTTMLLTLKVNRAV